MAKPTSDSSFTDDVATFYEATLVPLIFEPAARTTRGSCSALATTPPHPWRLT